MWPKTAISVPLKGMIRTGPFSSPLCVPIFFGHCQNDNKYLLVKLLVSCFLDCTVWKSLWLEAVASTPMWLLKKARNHDQFSIFFPIRTSNFLYTLSISSCQLYYFLLRLCCNPSMGKIEHFWAFCAPSWSSGYEEDFVFLSRGLVSLSLYT